MLAALDAVGLRTWVAGGWGVDALVGRETRMHRDLDVTHAPLEQALAALERLDYRRRRHRLAVNVADLPPFRYPPHACTTGSISGAPVRCLSIAQQLLSHQKSCRQDQPACDKIEAS